MELPFGENFSIVMTGVGCLLTQNTLDSNFMVGLAPQKKAPATHQLCSKTIGKMLLEVDLWGAFFWDGEPPGKLQTLESTSCPFSP